jgi:hypothetical protein
MQAVSLPSLLLVWLRVAVLAALCSSWLVLLNAGAITVYSWPDCSDPGSDMGLAIVNDTLPLVSTTT